jgi:uncharacterized FAD-dependent dehydrogenase
VLADGEEIAAEHVVLALGHSARDTFAMLHAAGVFMEAKPFAVGFRIEHPQSLIDRARLGPNAGNPLLGAADYKLVHHASNGRAVYSFCMCPAAQVVAATSEAELRGHQRHEPVFARRAQRQRRHRRQCHPGRLPGGPPLAGIAFQRQLEAHAFELGGGTTRRRPTGRRLPRRPPIDAARLGHPSYQPGVHLTDLATALPDYAIAAIREAIPAFDRQIRGFALPDAVLTGVETRTSSPLRITRGDDCRASTCGTLPGRRRRRLRRRHPLGRHRRHPRRRGPAVGSGRAGLAARSGSRRRRPRAWRSAMRDAWQRAFVPLATVQAWRARCCCLAGLVGGFRRSRGMVATPVVGSW